MDGRTDGRLVGWLVGWVDRWMDGMDGRTDGQMDGWMDGGRMDGWREGWREGEMDGGRDGGREGGREGGRKGWMDGLFEKERESRVSNELNERTCRSLPKQNPADVGSFDEPSDLMESKSIPQQCVASPGIGHIDREHYPGYSLEGVQGPGHWLAVHPVQVTGKTERSGKEVQSSSAIDKALSIWLL